MAAPAPEGEPDQPFTPITGFTGYRKLHDEIDLILDTQISFSTIADPQLCMGVPRLALTGPSPHRRAAAGYRLLAALPQSITRTEEEFLQKVAALDTDTSLPPMLRPKTCAHLHPAARRRAAKTIHRRRSERIDRPRTEAQLASAHSEAVVPVFRKRSTALSSQAQV